MICKTCHKIIHGYGVYHKKKFHSSHRFVKETRYKRLTITAPPVIILRHEVEKVLWYKKIYKDVLFRIKKILSIVKYHLRKEKKNESSM